MQSGCADEVTVSHIRESIGRIQRLRDDVSARRRQLSLQSRSTQAGLGTPVCFYVIITFAKEVM